MVVEVPAQDVRLPAQAIEALAAHVPVAVLLMSREDIELERDLARDREAREAEEVQIDALLAEADR